MKGGWDDNWIESSDDSIYIVERGEKEGVIKTLFYWGVSLLFFLATITIPESPVTDISTLVAKLNPGDVTFKPFCLDLSDNCGWEDLISLEGNDIK